MTYTRSETGADARHEPAPAGFTWCAICRAWQHPLWHAPEWRKAPERTPLERAHYAYAPGTERRWFCVTILQPGQSARDHAAVWAYGEDHALAIASTYGRYEGSSIYAIDDRNAKTICQLQLTEPRAVAA